MVTAIEVDPQLLVKKASEELKKQYKMPEWAVYVKTGVGKERPPEDRDWWYMRMAAILRNVYIRGPVGVSRLKTVYGGLHRRGHKPAHFAKGSGKVIRTILQDLEKGGLIQKQDKPKKGRVISKEGQKFLDNVAKSVGE